jgi:hypothetical protein
MNENKEEVKLEIEKLEERIAPGAIGSLGLTVSCSRRPIAIHKTHVPPLRRELTGAKLPRITAKAAGVPAALRNQFETTP